MHPEAHESASLHGHADVGQREVKRVDEGNSDEHFLLHLSESAHLERRRRSEEGQKEKQRNVKCISMMLIQTQQDVLSPAAVFYREGEGRRLQVDHHDGA